MISHSWHANLCSLLTLSQGNPLYIVGFFSLSLSLGHFLAQFGKGSSTATYQPFAPLYINPGAS